MFVGVASVIIACLFWGMIFVVPAFLEGFSAVEIALGRCLAFGTFSVGLLSFKKRHLIQKFSRNAWTTAFVLALVIYVVHYLSVVLGLRYANAALTTLIIGINPVCLSIYGSIKQKNYSFKSLLWPCVLLTLGLVLVNLPPFIHGDSSTDLYSYFAGIFFGLIALATWVWSGVKNADFLQKNPSMTAGDWITMMGVATFILAGTLACILAIIYAGTSHMEKYKELSDEIIIFLCGSIVLGLLSSWLGGLLWNRAAVRLPMALAGQLAIFETIFGLTFVFIVEGRIPYALEFGGIIVILIGVMLNFYQPQKT